MSFPLDDPTPEEIEEQGIRHDLNRYPQTEGDAKRCSHARTEMLGLGVLCLGGAIAAGYGVYRIIGFLMENDRLYRIAYHINNS